VKAPRSTRFSPSNGWRLRDDRLTWPNVGFFVTLICELSMFLLRRIVDAEALINAPAGDLTRMVMCLVHQ
jgi:hypothetical protein